MLGRLKRKKDARPENEIISKVLDVIQNSPPTVGVIGVSGVGKSSTINSLFKTDLPTSATIRCTREFSEHFVGAQVRRGPAEGQKAVLRVVDAPGLGEDLDADEQYLEMYNANLQQCDVILWVMMARNRAVALDQLYLQKLKKFHRKMVFGINQVDLIEPLDWDVDRNLPSELQQQRIEEIADDRRARIEKVVGRKVPLVAYAAKQHYRLIQLFELLIDACPKDRRWLFEIVRGTSAKDWLDRAQGISEEEKFEIMAMQS